MNGPPRTRATFKAPITAEDVLNSRMIAYPFRLLQCCLVTDGGGALILVSAKSARDFPQEPVGLRGIDEDRSRPQHPRKSGGCRLI
jgi:acetyl-CoA acetyltransferase